MTYSSLLPYFFVQMYQLRNRNQVSLSLLFFMHISYNFLEVSVFFILFRFRLDCQKIFFFCLGNQITKSTSKQDNKIELSIMMHAEWETFL